MAPGDGDIGPFGGPSDGLPPMNDQWEALVTLPLVAAHRLIRL